MAHPPVFDLLSRVLAGLGRSAAFRCPPCHGFPVLRCAEVRRNRYESVPVGMICAWSVSRSMSALHSRGLGITCDHSENGRLVVPIAAAFYHRAVSNWNIRSHAIYA